MNISFIIPCYNCEDYIQKNIYKLYNKLKNLKIKYEIILIDDCSTDKTFIYINELKNKVLKLKILRNTRNFGKSFSLIKGTRVCKYKHVIFIDCDLPYFKSIYSVIKYLKINDMVIINRRKRGSRMENYKLNLYQLLRILLGYLVNNFIRTWFNITIRDTQAGLKGFVKPKNFSRIKFVSKRFFFDLELILFFIFSKKKIFSLQTIYSVDRNSNINFFNLIKNFEILKELIKICVNYKSMNEKINNFLR
jgi:glycosyltransferase involved in cell wall biosynthesis|tara:strand:+ start:71 stop:817 length:747 start_codon:yes stop_codon:yes gene_type:complete